MPNHFTWNRIEKKTFKNSIAKKSIWIAFSFFDKIHFSFGYGNEPNIKFPAIMEIKWLCVDLFALPDRCRTWKFFFPLLVNMVNKHILYGKVHQFHILLVKCLIDTHKKELLSWIFHELFIVSRAWNWNRLGKVYGSDNFI